MKYKLLRFNLQFEDFKHKVAGISFISLLFVLFSVRGMGAYADLDLLSYDATVSMDFQDISLKDLLKIFSIQSGLNFIASEVVQNRQVTLYLDRVPVKEAMDRLFKANNLSYEYDQDSNIFIVKDWGSPEIETVTKVYFLKYASVTSSALENEVTANLRGASEEGEGVGKAGIIEAIKNSLSRNGNLVEDARTNSIIITDVPSRFSKIEEAIKRLDVPMPQLMIEVEMLDVSKNVVDAMGFSLGTNPFTLVVPGGFGGTKFYMGAATDRGSEGKITFGRTYAEALDFLRTQTDTKYLARPRIRTLNNETAEIKITTSESIGITVISDEESGSESATPERVETGVTLRLTPQANIETGEVTMFIFPKVTEANTGNSFTAANQSYTYRDPEERSTKSLVKVKDGETVIVGGLIRNEFNQELKKVPILGDIPLIGALFRHKNKTKDRERELLIFITPHIIKEDSVELAKTNKLPEIKTSLSLEREQQLSEAALRRKKSMSILLNNFER